MLRAIAPSLSTLLLMSTADRDPGSAHTADTDVTFIHSQANDTYVHPDAAEICDGGDNDFPGTADDTTPVAPH